MANRKVLIVGHRGASAYEPENTLRSVRRAFDLGVNLVEVDARLSKDGHLVVIHDETVDRTTNGSGHVRDMTLNQLKALNAGKGERIPALKEVLGLFKEGQENLIVEVKEPDLGDKILESILRSGITERIVISSFYHTVIREITRRQRNVRCGIIFVCQPVNPEKMALDGGASFLFPNFHYVNAEMVDRAHESNLTVIPWTINDKDTARRMIDLGADGITTDKPYLLTTL